MTAARERSYEQISVNTEAGFFSTTEHLLLVTIENIFNALIYCYREPMNVSRVYKRVFVFLGGEYQTNYCLPVEYNLQEILPAPVCYAGPQFGDNRFWVLDIKLFSIHHHRRNNVLPALSSVPRKLS
jgi:hypothetical protein